MSTHIHAHEAVCGKRREWVMGGPEPGTLICVLASIPSHSTGLAFVPHLGSPTQLRPRMHELNSPCRRSSGGSALSLRIPFSLPAMLAPCLPPARPARHSVPGLPSWSPPLPPPCPQNCRFSAASDLGPVTKPHVWAEIFTSLVPGHSLSSGSPASGHRTWHRNTTLGRAYALD